MVCSWEFLFYKRDFSFGSHISLQDKVGWNLISYSIASRKSTCAPLSNWWDASLGIHLTDLFTPFFILCSSVIWSWKKFQRSILNPLRGIFFVFFHEIVSIQELLLLGLQNVSNGFSTSLEISSSRVADLRRFFPHRNVLFPKIGSRWVTEP